MNNKKWNYSKKQYNNMNNSFTYFIRNSDVNKHIYGKHILYTSILYYIKITIKSCLKK